MIKACIFDLDGVIVDSSKYHFSSWRKVLLEVGVNLTEKENEMIKGRSRKESLDIVLKKHLIELSSREKRSIMGRKNDYYVTYIQSMDLSHVFDGVRDFIDMIKEEGIRTSIASASKNAKIVLKKIEMVDYFDAILDGHSVTYPKPNPEIFLRCALAMKVEPNECIVFEDSISGIDAAKKAGMYSVGIGKKDDLSNSHFVVSNIKNINWNRLKELYNEFSSY